MEIYELLKTFVLVTKDKRLKIYLLKELKVEIKKFYGGDFNSDVVIYDDNSHSNLTLDQFKYDFAKSNNRLLQFICSDPEFINKVKSILEKEILRGNT